MYQAWIFKSGTVSYKAGRYYAFALVVEQKMTDRELKNYRLGRDLGVKEFVVCSGGRVYKNINKTARLKKLEKWLKRMQCCFSRKYEELKKRSDKKEKESGQNYVHGGSSLQEMIIPVVKVITYKGKQDTSAVNIELLYSSSCITDIMVYLDFM